MTTDLGAPDAFSTQKSPSPLLPGGGRKGRRGGGILSIKGINKVESKKVELVFDAGEARSLVGDFGSWQELKHSALVQQLKPNA